MGASRVKGITIELQGDSTKLQTALKQVDTQLRSTQQQLKDVDKLLKLDPGNTELLAQKHKLLGDAVKDTKERLETLKTAAEQANTALANGEISQQQYDALQREIVETEQELKRLEEQANQSATALQKIAADGEKLKTMGDNVTEVGKKFLPVTGVVAGLGTAAVKTAADFDSSMSKVAAVSGATGSDLDALREKAREMGAKTKFSASEAADAMNYMAMAGWKTSDMLSGIEGVMNLAAASGEDLATTSDIVTDALTAFGLTAEDSGHFADILAAASSNANTNVAMMGETFKYCAPIAGALGFSAEDTAEAIGLMANAGIKSSQAGTALRTIMNNLTGDIELSGQALGDVTIQTTNADGSMRSLSDILADCRGAFSQLTESEQAQAAESLVGKNAMSGFLALMNALDGKIDLIVTKSVSRFARNTVDSLSTLRKLKEKGTECYFEKENIWTFDSRGELLITIMSSLAQEESRSISENVTWGHRKRFSDGKVMVPFGRFLGYERGENGNLVVNEEQAKIVRRIYQLFIDGHSAYSIAKILTADGIKSPGGKDTWSGSTVKSILSNEKYKGCALLQKVYTVDYLTKKKKKNEGEVPRYFVEDSHPAIIEPDLFDLVQAEIARRQECGNSNNYSGIGPFAAKVKCGECGGWFGSKVWHSTDKYRRVIYQCNHKYSGGQKCGTPHVTENELKEGFIVAFNSLLSEKDELLEDIRTVRETLKSSDALEKEKADLEQEMAVVADLMDKCVDENARVAQDQEDYRKRYAALEERYEAAKKKHGETLGKIAKADAREKMLAYFAKTIRKQKPVESFSEQLWNTVTDYVTVDKDGKLAYRFKNGSEVTV